MPTIKLTSKRQATFPRAVCEEMNLRPGDRIELEPAEVDGQQVWVLRPKEPLEMPWFGRFREYARGKPHDMKSIRKSIAEARKRGDI
ncbi:AbrB/MazE/SpoVT family DNA-binding domain-containing protein [bacterium]|nr:AbrB/MazE/SpoVT family DNA-binding domain-containing protein [bacterium]